MAVLNRLSVIAGVGLAAGMTFGLGVGPAQAAKSPQPQPQPQVRSQVSDGQDLYQMCPDTPHEFGACIFGINGAQAFTGPNQLGPSAPYNLANRNNQWTFGCVSSHGNPPRGFPLTFPQQGTEVSIFSEILNCASDGGNRIIARADWDPPAPLPAGDTAAIHYNNMWSNDNGLGSPSFWCASSKFTQCDVIHTSQAFRSETPAPSLEWYTSFVYQIRNLPFIVEINNNLPASDNDDLVIDGTPQVSQFILDPNGGNPQTIKAGESGYFGLYAATATSSASQGFSVTYNVSPSSTDIPGSSISLDVVIDPKTGSLDKSSTCTFNVAVQNQAGSCDFTLLGGPRAVQTLVVNIYE